MNNKLTDKDIIKLQKALAKQRTEDIKRVEEMEKAIKLCDNDNGKYPVNTLRNKGEIESNEVKATVNTDGTYLFEPLDEETVKSISDRVDDMFNINEEDIREFTKGKFDGFNELPEKDMEQLIQVLINRLNNKNFNVFSSLPESVKKMVRSLCNGDFKPATLNSAANGLIDFFINTIKEDKGLTDFNKALSQELGISNLYDIYGENQKENMEVNLREKAKLLREKGYIEKADILDSISSAYTKAYNFEIFKDAIKNNSPKLKRLDKAVRKYNKICRDFNYKYESCEKFTIKDVNLISQVLSRHFDGPNDLIAHFTILFCRLCENLDPNNVSDHTLMYYTIDTITGLDFYNKDGKKYKEITDNISFIFDALVNIAEKEKKFIPIKNNKNKKRKVR